MNGRPGDRRGYISQPRERSPRRFAKRHHSRESREREHRKRQMAPREHLHMDPIDMQTTNGSDDEGRRRFVRNPNNDPYNRIIKDIRCPPERMPEALPDDFIREGIVFMYENYFEFLRSWLEESNRILVRYDISARPRRIEDSVTPTTLAEKSHIILPPGDFKRNDLLHCDMTIGGLPPSVFFGSGFGPRPALARNAAAKDLIDKCFRVGLITEALHASIGNRPFFKKIDLPRTDYYLAVDALIDLYKKMHADTWPYDIYSARELEEDVLGKLKFVFDSVNADIYSRGRQRDQRGFPNVTMDDSMNSGFIGNRERTEFCHRCKHHGHLERDCRNISGEKRPRESPRSPVSLREWREERRYERSHRMERYVPFSGSGSSTTQLTPDEIAQKIAQQREELLRREMMMRGAQPMQNSHLLGSRDSFSTQQPLLYEGGPTSLDQCVTPLADINFVETQARAAREEEELRSRIEAEAWKMEEEHRLREKEKELERRLQQEFEEKKRTLEEEIRRQVQMEERAKLQLELAQSHHLPQQLQASERFYPIVSSQTPNSSSYAMPPSFSSFGGINYGTDPNTCAYSSTPDFEMEEIKRLIKETEDKLLDLQRNAREAELSAIFQSRAFQTVAELGDNAYMLDRSQKQHLLCELKELLSHAGPLEKEMQSSDMHNSCSHSRDRRRNDRQKRSHTLSRRSKSPRNHSSCKSLKDSEPYKEVRHHIGSITLRNLTPAEQRRLKIGDIVVARDMKTGKWTTAHVSRISDDRATLTIGNASWKKRLNELFKEVSEWSA